MSWMMILLTNITNQIYYYRHIKIPKSILHMIY